MKNILKISIAEDEAIIAQYLKMELEFAGYQVTGLYSNSNECIKAAEELDIDVLLLDIHLNGAIDGIKTAEKILKFKNVKIIFMTGFSEEQIKKRALKLEPLAFLNKPVEIEDILPILNKIG